MGINVILWSNIKKKRILNPVGISFRGYLTSQFLWFWNFAGTKFCENNQTFSRR